MGDGPSATSGISERDDLLARGDGVRVPDRDFGGIFVVGFQNGDVVSFVVADDLVGFSVFPSPLDNDGICRLDDVGVCRHVSVAADEKNPLPM
jgi:hypothetical protein